MNTKNIDLKAVKPAKRYALAFFEVIKNKDFKKDLSDIKKLIDFIQQDKKAKNFFYHPIVSREDKKQVIKESFKDFSVETLNLICILIDENRLDCLDEIYDFVNEKINKTNKILNISITSAIELNEEQKNYIKERLKNKFQNEIMPEYSIDKSIMGGLIIKVQDTVIDLSLIKKLENFKVI